MDLSLRFHVNRPKVVHEILDGEAVIIDFNTGNYYSLDDVGTAIWSFIQQGASLSEILEGLAGRYEGERAKMESGLRNFLADLKRENLIVAANSNEAGSTAQPERRAETGSGSDKSRFKVPKLYRYSDMQELLLLDPIHEVDESGWPATKPERFDE